MIPLFKVYMPADAADRIKNVIFSGYIAEGEHVRGFEERLKKFWNNQSVITTNSCTSALHLALKMCNVSTGDVVFTTPMTCLATNVSIENIGATPVWIDSDPIHGMMSPNALEDAFKTMEELPKAVIYVCWGGDFGDIKLIDHICRKYDVPLIIDAAQAFSKEIVAYGRFVCFSFQAIKHITTGDGGALVMNLPSDYKRAFTLKWFGIDRDGFRTPNGEINWTADVPEIGFKFHMNNIAGCIGKAQLDDPNFARRLENYRENDKELTQKLNPYKNHIYRTRKGHSASWVATFNCDNPIELLEFLKEKGIHASQMHVNNDIYSGFARSRKFGTLTGVHTFMEHHICLPCGYWVTPKDIDYMVECIKEFYHGCK